MRLLVLSLVLALLASGCVSLLPSDEEPAAELEPTDFEPETAPTPSPTTPATPTSSTPPSPSPGAKPSPTPGPQTGSDVAPAPPAPPAVTTWDGSITAAGASAPRDAPVQLCCPSAEAEGENVVVTFDVPAGLKAIVVELAWTQGQAPADLDLVLDAPDVSEPLPPGVNGTAVETRPGHWWIDDAGTPADTTASATIVVTDAEALALTGTWTWRVLPKGPANAVTYRVAVSLFADAPPAEGYSALATPSGNP